MRRKSSQFISFILIGLLFLFFIGCNEVLTIKKSIPENFDVEKMELHQEIYLNPNESVIRILRGWIYISWQDDLNIDYAVFVPLERK